MATKKEKPAVKTNPTRNGEKRSTPDFRDDRPTHIAVFKKVSEENLEVCTSVLGAEASTKSLNVQQLKRDGHSAGKMYSRLGVAAISLNQAELKAILDTSKVEAVFKNEIRSLPKPISETAPFVRDPDFSGIADYLRGVRDGLNLTLAHLQGADTFPGLFSMENPSVVASVAQRDTRHWPLEMIGMHENYTKYTGRGIKVAILDTGIDLNHPDFEGRLEEGVSAESFITGESVQDENGHGTHCAGVIAGPLMNNGSRRYGVAPDVDLLIGKVLSNAGSGYDDQIIDGIEWAEEAGAQIISMSLGSPRRARSPFYPLYERVARNMLASNPGVLLIAAAGNESARPNWVAPVGNPASCPSIMAVSAIDQYRRVAYFSCAQTDEIGEVNVTAPGVRIYSTWTGGGYKSISGTSMATPHAAGVAALYLEQNPEMTPRELWKQLEMSAQPIDPQVDFGAGIIQAP